MKKIGLFLIIAVFVSVFASTSYAKNTYINAGQADNIFDLEISELDGGAKSGLVLDIEEKDGLATYYIDTNKIKKLYVYGDARGGYIAVLLMKINSQTGDYEWIGENPSQVEPTALDFSSGKVQVIDNTIKKSKKEKWALIIVLSEGETEGVESPIVHGIKYKS